MEGKGPPLRPFEYPAVRRMVFAVLAIAAAHFLFALLSFKGLPARIPIHFNIHGVPDGFAGASVANWFMLFFISATMGVLLMLLALGVDRFPVKYLNVPRREEFLNLPAWRRSKEYGVLAFHLLLLTSIMMLFMGLLHVVMALTAHGIVEKIPVVWMVVGLGSTTLEVVVMTWHLVKVIGREIDEHARLPVNKRTGILS